MIKEAHKTLYTLWRYFIVTFFSLSGTDFAEAHAIPSTSEGVSQPGMFMSNHE